MDMSVASSSSSLSQLDLQVLNNALPVFKIHGLAVILEKKMGQTPRAVMKYSIVDGCRAT
jgi:hypothetical protein